MTQTANVIDIHPPRPDDLVYIRSLVHQDKRSRLPVWWRKNSSGYTEELTEAGLYRREDAEREQASTHGDNIVVEPGAAYMADHPEHDLGKALSMVAQDDPRQIKIVAWNPGVLPVYSGLIWDAGSYLKKISFHRDNTAGEEHIEVRPWWFGKDMHRWQVVPLEMLRWRAQAEPPLDPEKLARDAMAAAVSVRTCPAGCLPAWSRGRQAVVFLDIKGDPCSACGGSGQRR